MPQNYDFDSSIQWTTEMPTNNDFSIKMNVK